MAKTTAPLMSLDASGSVAKTITFSKWKGRNYVRQTVVPANPKTPAQHGTRAGMKFLSQEWKNLAAGIQTHWADAAKATNITPMNQFVKVGQKAIRAGTGPIEDPTFTPGASGAAPTGGAAAPSYQTLTVTWADSVQANDFCTVVYGSKTNGFTPAPSNIVGIIAHGVQKFVHNGLKTGDTWYYRLAGDEQGGTLTALAAQFSGVVG